VEIRRTVRIVNDQGLHARPCHSIVSAAQAFRSELSFRSGEREVNGKSIIDLMTLGAGFGVELEVCAKGGDANDLIEIISTLFAEGFGEVAS
jgi:phosphocarrier protein HPr